MGELVVDTAGRKTLRLVSSATMVSMARSASGLIGYCQCRGCTGPSIRSGGERTRPQSCLLVAQTSGTNWQTVPKAPSPVQSRVIGTQCASAATNLLGTHLPSRALLWDLRDIHRRRRWNASTTAPGSPSRSMSRIVPSEFGQTQKWMGSRMSSISRREALLRRATTELPPTPVMEME
ncbi:hypothetical protein chiPu_0023103 [Chiloscyllium punctatum]|uniref:Uncharacterized protein n=1 Tax=Chiloscyllium punctatum TaxID=137246 RepID=A0A401T8L7_CHIPU|nr:hypothetical protein [Chiloscyllium punctatum]